MGVKLLIISRVTDRGIVERLSSRYVEYNYTTDSGQHIGTHTLYLWRSKGQCYQKIDSKDYR